MKIRTNVKKCPNLITNISLKMTEYFVICFIMILVLLHLLCVSVSCVCTQLLITKYTTLILMLCINKIRCLDVDDNSQNLQYKIKLIILNMPVYSQPQITINYTTYKIPVSWYSYWNAWRNSMNNYILWVMSSFNVRNKKINFFCIK